MNEFLKNEILHFPFSESGKKAIKDLADSQGMIMEMSKNHMDAAIALANQNLEHAEAAMVDLPDLGSEEKQRLCVMTYLSYTQLVVTLEADKEQQEEA